MKKLLKKVRTLPFSTKLIGVYILSLLLVTSIVTYEQITGSVDRLRRESEQNLEIFTDQIALNFAEHQYMVVTSMYSRLCAFEVPTLMSNTEDYTGMVKLSSALSQMVTTASDYDFVMVELNNGVTLNTSCYKDTGWERYLSAECSALLEQNTSTGSAGTWYRSEDGEVYVLRDIFDTEPLTLMGRGVFHMRSNLFEISGENANVGFLFFDDGHYLMSAGMPIEDAALDSIISFIQQGGLPDTASWEDDDYFYFKNTGSKWVTVGYSSKEVYHDMRKNIISVSLFYCLIGLAAGSGVVWLTLRSMTKKLRLLKESMDRVSEGNLSTHVEVKGNDDISQMSESFNYMTERISELLEELLEKERAKTEAEFQILEYKYRSLETQIRPHFIYNALEVVNAMAKINGNDDIVDATQRISKYFRSISVNTTKQFITTQQEFDSLEDYTEIYKLIHGKKLHTVFRARENARNAMIPTMIMQPVVENALKHGLRAQNEDSELIVHAYIKDNQLVLTVKDNGYGLTEEQLKTMQESGSIPSNSRGGIGLGNVRQRLELLYNGQASFEICNREEQGVKVSIHIPLAYVEPDISADDDWDWDDD